MDELREYDRIVNLIYDAAIDDGLWPEVVRAIARSTGGFGGALVVFDRVNVEFPVFHQSGFAAEFYRDYAAHYVKIDPRAEPFLAHPGIELYDDAMLISDDIKRGHEYFDWESKNSDQRFGYGARLVASAEREAALILARNAAQGHASRADFERLSRFLPHLRRAIAVSRRVGDRTAETALEALSVGVMIVDGEGNAAFWNRALAAIAAQNDGLALTNHGLMLDDADAQRALRRALDAALRRAHLDAAATRPVLLAGRPSGKRGYGIVLCPLGPRAGLSLDAGPSVMVCVSDPTATDHLNEQVLGGLFALTSAEARVARAFAEGQDVNQIAGRHGVSRETVRAQAKAVFRKTGTNRQSEVAALLAGLPRFPSAAE